MRPATTIVLAVLLLALFGAAILQLVVLGGRGDAVSSVPGAGTTASTTVVSTEPVSTVGDTQSAAT